MTDRDLQQRIEAVFDREPGIQTARIGVAVNLGVVTLYGSVPTLQERWTAERAARHVPEVRAVANDIEVLSARRVPRTDAAIARAIPNTLAWQTAVPAGAIHAEVRDGWVTLSGAVDHPDQKRAAERVVRMLYGVKGIFSRVTVRAPAPPAA